MTKEQLIAKRALYEAKKVELTLANNNEQIELKVAEYRQKLEAEFAEQKQTDMQKVNCYLELLDELIAEQEIVENEKDVADIEQDDVSTVTSEASI